MGVPLLACCPMNVRGYRVRVGDLFEALDEPSALVLIAKKQARRPEPSPADTEGKGKAKAPSKARKSTNGGDTAPRK